MSQPGAMHPAEVAIIGGGASGALTAWHLVQGGFDGRIVIVEPRSQLGLGVAYSTPYDEHLLNVTTGRLGIDARTPGDFVDWLRASGRAEDAAIGDRFVPRRWFGDYLAARVLPLLRERIVHVQEQAMAFTPGNITLASGARLRAEVCVLATGNQPRILPVAVPPALSARVHEAWDYPAIRALPVDADVCVVGTGLSMVDVLLTLHANGHRGRVLALSRHALLPLSHGSAGVREIDLDALLALPLRGRMRRLRTAAGVAARDGVPWQWLMQGLRPHGVALWQTLSDRDRACFLRHAARHWDVHRHRIAPQAAQIVQSWLRDGRLQLIPARLQSIEGDGARIAVRHGGSADALPQRVLVDRIVNATGIALRLADSGNPLLESLHASGRARPGPHALGIDVDADGAVIDATGLVRGDLYAIGSLRIGVEWESVAIPELRAQAARITERIVTMR